jgi:UDP-N-acetylglucosamine 2-epimerase (non-hydrolysing)
LTLRDNTERPETVTIGSNVLVGTDPGRLPPVMDELFEGRWKSSGIPALWDGGAGHRIVGIIERIFMAAAGPAGAHGSADLAEVAGS